MTDNALTIATTGENFLSPAATIAQLRERYLIFNQFVKDVLRDGVDYQIIPGTGTKPSLVKPGAEKLASLFGLSARFSVAERTEDWGGEQHGGEPFFYYLYRCELYRGDRFVASCDGSCNSREKKYRYRSADVTCPACGKNTIIKGKAEYGGGWICFAKKGGCGAKYGDNDPKIIDQPRGLIPNPDVADQVNTLQKMAQKRAFVGAVLIATNASEYFTQDIEEMPGFVDADYHEVPVEKPQQQRQPEPATVTAARELGGVVAEEPMTLEEAMAVTASDGTPYGDLTDDELDGRVHGINKAMQKPGATEKTIAEGKRKLMAITVIQASRKADAESLAE